MRLFNERRLSGNGEGRRTELSRPEPPREATTGETLAAVARDAIDVASELVRDGVTLGRLEVERAAREMAPRVVWGAVTAVCLAVGGVLAIIAFMLVLGSVVPSVAGRLAILAGALFVVGFFGAVRVMRPGTQASRAEARSASEPTESEQRIEEEPGPLPRGLPGRAIPPPGQTKSF